MVEGTTPNPAATLPSPPNSEIAAKIAQAEAVLEKRRQLVSSLENLAAIVEQCTLRPIPGLSSWLRSVQPTKKTHGGGRLSWRDALQDEEGQTWQERCLVDPQAAASLDKVIDQDAQLTHECRKWEIIALGRQSLAGVSSGATFPRTPPEVLPIGPDGIVKLRKPPRSQWVSVDAVLDSGNEWLKIITLSEKTLLYQMAEAGCWDGDTEDEEQEESDDHGNGKDTPPDRAGHATTGLLDTDQDVPIVKTVVDLICAAKLHHCRTLRIVFTKIDRGRTKEVDDLFDRIQHSCTPNDLLVLEFANGERLAQRLPDPDVAAFYLMPLDFSYHRVTATVNLDPSVMLALISDINHGELSRQSPAHKKILAMALRESADSDLLSRERILIETIYPALSNRTIVCTRAAADYFRRVVNLLATDTEYERAKIIFPTLFAPEEEPRANSPEREGLNIGGSEPFLGPGEMSDTELLRCVAWMCGFYDPVEDREDKVLQRRTHFEPLARLFKLSSHHVPDELYFPVQIVDDFTAEDVQPAIDAGTLPGMAANVSSEMSDMNRSVYFYGWAHGITTLTSHRGVARQVELLVARHWEKPGDYGPHVWQHWMAGFLLYRDKPKDWLEILGGECPPELRRWLQAKTTWGRGINIFGLTDSPTWKGVGTWVEEKDD